MKSSIATAIWKRSVCFPAEAPPPGKLLRQKGLEFRSPPEAEQKEVCHSPSFSLRVAERAPYLYKAVLIFTFQFPLLAWRN